MQYVGLGIITLIFLFLNFKIFIHDIREKKIPNQLLLGLLVLFASLLVLGLSYGYTINLYSLFKNFCIATIVSFCLYSIGIWSAWDAKYLLVLSLYVLNTGIFPFIGNIALITLLYLMGYYVYFYIQLLYRGQAHLKSFFQSMKKDKTDILRFFIEWYHIDRAWWYRIIRFLMIFLIFFVSIRLLRSYIMDEVQSLEWIRAYSDKNPTDFALLFWVGIFGIAYVFRFAAEWIKSLWQRFFHGNTLTQYGASIFPFLVFVILLGFIVFEYRIHPYEIGHKLFLIFTVYLMLFLIAKIALYSYKITFHVNETDTIDISHLRWWEIIDKTFLIKQFWSQDAFEHMKVDGKLENPHPVTQQIKEMENPIDSEGIVILKKIYAMVNQYHNDNNTPGFHEFHEIKILRVFAFWGYIFAGFLVTLLFWELPVRMIIQGIFHIIGSWS